MPFTRIEVAVMSITDRGLCVLLGRRVGAPYAGRWALPGGVVRIDLDHSLEGAADRVIEERLETRLPVKRQLCAVGGPVRDPRAWSLSVVYWALLPYQSLKPTAGRRIEALRWTRVEDAMIDSTLAFDHAEIIQRAVVAIRREVDELELPFDFLPHKFTLGELQETCEGLLGRKLDKSSFRRRLAERELVQPVDGEMRTGAFRPAQIYRRNTRYALSD